MSVPSYRSRRVLLFLFGFYFSNETKTFGCIQYISTIQSKIVVQSKIRANELNIVKKHYIFDFDIWIEKKYITNVPNCLGIQFHNIACKMKSSPLIIPKQQLHQQRHREEKKTVAIVVILNKRTNKTLTRTSSFAFFPFCSVFFSRSLA